MTKNPERDVFLARLRSIHNAGHVRASMVFGNIGLQLCCNHCHESDKYTASTIHYEWVPDALQFIEKHQACDLWGEPATDFLVNRILGISP